MPSPPIRIAIAETPQAKPLQRGGPLFAGGILAGLAHRDLLVERLDAFDCGVSVGAFAQPDLEEADLALLLRDLCASSSVTTPPDSSMPWPVS
jgi:hypothetical protein